MKNFRAYQISKDFYDEISRRKWPQHLNDQILRASSSIVLNLAEGSGLPSPRQKSRHYNIAMGSLRECQAVIELAKPKDTKIISIADNLAAHIFKLCKSTT